MKAARSFHRIVSIAIALPLLITILSGFLLINRSRFEWVQPSQLGGFKLEGIPLLSMEKVQSLAIFQDKEIDQVIFKPSKNTYTVRLKNSDMEFQLHAQSSEVLKQRERRTSWLVALHEGAYWGNWSRDFIYIPTLAGLLMLWCTGVYLFFKTRKKGR